LSKRQPYSGVQRCHQHHARTTHSGGSRPWSSTTPQLPPEPCRLPATDQASLQTPPPLPRRSHPRRISASQSPPCPCPNTPHNHLSSTESSRPTFHHRQLPRPAGFTGPRPVPTSVQPAQLRNTATPPTSTTPQRPPLTNDLRKRPLLTALPAVREKKPWDQIPPARHSEMPG
jgi:hypothetical protein